MEKNFDAEFPPEEIDFSSVEALVNNRYIPKPTNYQVCESCKPAMQHLELRVKHLEEKLANLERSLHQQSAIQPSTTPNNFQTPIMSSTNHFLQSLDKTTPQSQPFYQNSHQQIAPQVSSYNTPVNTTSAPSHLSNSNNIDPEFDEIEIHTDGSCLGNPGVGGWCAVIAYRKSTGTKVKEEIIKGGESATTNNQMEMMSAISALEFLTRKGIKKCKIYTDSKYLKDGITSWIIKWRENGWKTAKHQQVVNMELWMRLDSLTKQITVQWEWLKGHNGHPMNEKADTIARSEAEKRKEILL